MASVKSTRIQSIDILRGLVMVIMALDHVRDYFHLNGLAADPSNLDTTTPTLFFTRFITNFCAPVFILLSGTSAFLYGQNKSKKELSKFLFTRGLWLIFIEIVVMNLLWWFDPTYSFINLQVIWVIGWSMIALSLIIYLPIRLILMLGLLIFFGQYFLSFFKLNGQTLIDFTWYALHQGGMYLTQDRAVMFLYPIIPWVGIISLGYCFGQLYIKHFNALKRKRILLQLGIGSIILFFALRYINDYGNFTPWSEQEDITYTILSFFKLSKYPPSLNFFLITIGPSLLFLYAIENIKNRISNILLVYGRVPFFYYIMHVLVIHIGAIIGLLITGGDWGTMLMTKNTFFNNELLGYGYSLFTTYIIWIGVVAILYPICRWYMKYKANHKDKWWLSYL